MFAGGEVYPNYYVEEGGQEKDLFIRYGDAIVLIECKNCRIRPFKGGADDLLKFEEDFKNSVQLGYDQALAVKRRILDNAEVVFFDDEDNSYFSVKRDEIKEIYIVCVTITPRGPFGTDLSYQLNKPGSAPFPLTVNLFDFDVICKHLNQPEQLIAYLRSRERLHGRVQTGDELNFAGYFVEFGNLEFEDGTFLDDSFSGVFDRRWYKEKDIDVEEPTNSPVFSRIVRSGNRIAIEHSAGAREGLRVPPGTMEWASGKPVVRMKGSDRNKPCYCGSGHKLKYCHGA